MPLSNYISVEIGGQQVELKDPEDVLTISYKQEDVFDFQNKQASEALGLVIPATRLNDKVGNTYHNPSVEDLSTDKIFREPRTAIIRAGGIELLRGKAFLQNAKHKDVPTAYEYSLFGNNGDWIIDLKESTLYDFLKQLTFEFTKANIIASWAYDGTDKELPYVFAPVRFGQPMDTMNSLVDGNSVEDYNMVPEYMKPSLSKYWIIYWAFQSLGYSVKSEFFDSDYFRRQVMPWTWGAFLDTDGTKLDVLKFLAMSTQSTSLVNTNYDDFWDAMVANDSVNGAYDNSGTYAYDAGAKEMKWTYPTTPNLDFGPLDARFHINIFADATIAGADKEIKLVVYWYKNGVEQLFTQFYDHNRGPFETIGRTDEIGNYEDFQTFRVEPGDIISAKVFIKEFNHGIGGRANINLFVEAFEISYFRIPLGGTIDFSNYLGLKEFKFLDFLAGVCDEFNIVPQTDTTIKAVYFEPTHPYAIGNDLSAPAGGYFNGKMVDWSAKQDLSKESTIENFSDSERELIFKYKDDSNDGGLKKTQDRNNNILALGKYVFPERFKSGQREIENRFFSPTLHYDVKQWAFDDLDPPQMVIMAPENISNVSAGEAQNTLSPKSCYYKGTTTDWKWVFDGDNDQPYPFMFAVNYRAGGEEDPILSYADESIGPEDDPDSNVIGKGLLRRFFLQRLEIMRNGQYYTTWFHLNNNDVANFLHREHIICRGQKWELVSINDYNPLREESTQVLLRKWSPIVNVIL